MRATAKMIRRGQQQQQRQQLNPFDQQQRVNSGTGSSSSSSSVVGNNFGQRQGPSLSPFEFNYPESMMSPSQPLDKQQQQSPYASYGKLNTNFKLNGDQALMTYPGLDVLFSSDMVDLVPLVGIGQTFKGFLNSFPVQLATSAHSGSGSGVGVTSNSGTGAINNNNARGPLDSFFSSYYTTPRPSFESNSVFEIKSQTDYFEKLRRCPLPAAVLCVTSDKEFGKCQAMSKAFHAAGLKPELNCKLAQSSLACMQLIKNRDADLAVLDAADIYLAGHKFGLMPIVAEQIEMHDPNHYAVAVVKKSDLATDLFNLKGKNSCHSGFLKGAGWVMPISFLLSNDRMRHYEDCNSARSAAEHFEKGCAPGILSAMSSIHNASSWTIRNMCELCHGSGRGYCARDASEPFFGDTGSFRCLIEGGGQVAFCKHTTIFENTGGSNRETWARNLIKSDFELLCRDGSRAPVNEYKSCNLGRVPPSAIVTRGDTPFQLIDTYVNLFMYGQQYYGSKYSEEYTFKMFSSTNGRDLIFQDATQRLVRIPLVNQTYRSYLNHEFLRAIECSELN
uniref:Melanotransferrin n=1 Tax=Aceria tosichella TaxID=561515 RepID=A0A6G1S5H7_9ACAR